MKLSPILIVHGLDDRFAENARCSQFQVFKGVKNLKLVPDFKSLYRTKEC